MDDVPAWAKQQTAPPAPASGDLPAWARQAPAAAPAQSSQLPPVTIHPPGGPATPDRMADADTYARSSLLDAPMALARRAGQAVQEVPGAIGDAFKAGEAQSVQGMEDISKDNAAGPAKVALGAAGQLFSPLTGVIDAFVKKPIAEVSGSERIGDAAADIAGLLPIEAGLPKWVRGAAEAPKPPRVEPTFPSTPAQANRVGVQAVDKATAPIAASVGGYGAVRDSLNQGLIRQEGTKAVDEALTRTAEPRAIEPGRANRVTLDHTKPAGLSGKTFGEATGLTNYKTVEQSKAAKVAPWHEDVTKALHELANRFGLEVLPQILVGKRENNLLIDGFASGFSQIVLHEGMDADRAMKVALHEFGHTLDFSVVDLAPKEVREALDKAYRDFLASPASKTMDKGFHMPLTLGEGKFSDPEYLGYLTKQREWFAEQVSRWLTQTAEPRTVLDKFFKGAADRWKAIYARLTGKYNPVAKEVDAFLRGRWRDEAGMFSKPGDFDKEITHGSPKPIANPTIPFDAKDALAGAERPSRAAGSRPQAAGAAATPTVDLYRDLKLRFPEEKPRSVMAQAARGLRAMLAPTTVDDMARLAKGDIRAERGAADRASARTKAAFDAVGKVVGPITDEEGIALIDYIENRSQQQPFADAGIQKLVDTVRDAMEQRRAALEALPDGENRQFVEDYISHMYQDPKQAARKLLAKSPEGSTGFTKQRKYATLEDGIRAGLVPITVNPLELATRYVENVDRYLATEHIFEQGKREGTIKYHGKLNPAPEGWTELQTRKQTLGDQRPYAPDGWARLYNNHTSRGWGGDVGDVFRGLQKASNTISGLELGFSGYHAFTTAKQGIVSQVASAVDKLMAGRPADAATTYVKSFAAPVSMARTGAKVRDAYLGLGYASTDYAKVADLLEKAGGRLGKGGIADEYRFSDRTPYWKAFKQGTLGRELKRQATNIRSSPWTGAPKEVLGTVQRIMEDVSAPLFEKYIPNMKAGAFYEGMKTWLENHPTAGQAEQIAAARDLWDSVDNRLGEMVQDNLFWNKTLRQSAQLSMLSFSYNIGTYREMLGSARQIAMSPRDGWTNRASYLIALPLALAPIAAAYQYLKTGAGPDTLHDLVHDPMKAVKDFAKRGAPQSPMDLIAPRTGGKTKDGREAERLLVPGDIKEFFGLYDKGPLQEIGNKLSPLVRTSKELATNRDWRNDPRHPIVPEDATMMEALKDYLGHIVKATEPFSLENVLHGGRKGSNISAVERAIGFREVPRGISEPHESAQGAANRGRSQRRTMERDEAQYKGTQ